MALFGKRPPADPPHPRREPRLEGKVTVERLEEVFRDCVDFSCRRAAVGGNEAMEARVVFLAGMVRTERVSDYLLRPLAEDRELGRLGEAAAWEKMCSGSLYTLSVTRRESLDDAVGDLIDGNCLLLFPGREGALSFGAGTEEKRSISAPEDEVSVKGAKDSFVENLRTNTSLVRRHIKAPELRLTEQTVGRQSLTPVDVVWVEGIADPRRVDEVKRRLEEIDIDALLSAGDLEEYLCGALDTSFPLMQYTQRPDRFCRGLCEGRVGILAEGLPLGYLAPAVLGDFLRAPEDRSENWLGASALTVLRWLCLLGTLYLPGLYVALADHHWSMLPLPLALSIAAARQAVPFSTLFETVLLLIAFEILQEAGRRLPPSIGQTVSILGGLVVGSAAVEARLISPAVLVVVAAAGMAGYTMPSQDLALALRLWRLMLSLLAGAGGLFGIMAGTAVLVGHLSCLESFGSAWLEPFAGGEPILAQPLSSDKLRPAHLNTENRRKQR